MMKLLMERYFDALVAAREQLLLEVSSLSADQQRFRPHQNAWSALEVVNHLLVAEQSTYQFIAMRRVPGRMPARKQWHHDLRMVIMILALKSPLKFKMPAKLSNPATHKSFAELREEWLATYHDLRQYTNRQPETFFDAQVFKHPFFGFFDFRATLIFLTEHIRHHLLQIQRLQKQKHFPPA